MRVERAAVHSTEWSLEQSEVRVPAAQAVWVSALLLEWLRNAVQPPGSEGRTVRQAARPG